MKNKTLKLALFLVGTLFLVAPSLMADSLSTGNALAQTKDRPLILHRNTDPAFPLTLIDKVREGEVRLVVSVDAQGKLLDHLFVAYSKQPFVRAVKEVIDSWTFEPAIRNGEPVAVVSELSIYFERDGIVVNTTFEDIVDNFLHPSDRDRMEYEPVSLRHIDRIPEPVKVVSPTFTTSMRTAGMVGDVTVTFYINENGEVKMPSISRSENAYLSEAAMIAIKQWQFAPPTKRGRPVLVKACQVFRFEDKPVAAVAAPAPSN